MVKIDVDCLAKLSKIHKKLPWGRACTPDKIKRGVSYVEKKDKCTNSKKCFSKFQLIQSYFEGECPMQMKQIKGYSLCKKTAGRRLFTFKLVEGI